MRAADQRQCVPGGRSAAHFSAAVTPKEIADCKPPHLRFRAAVYSANCPAGFSAAVAILLGLQLQSGAISSPVMAQGQGAPPSDMRVDSNEPSKQQQVYRAGSLGDTDSSITVHQNKPLAKRWSASGLHLQRARDANGLLLAAVDEERIPGAVEKSDTTAGQASSGPSVNRRPKIGLALGGGGTRGTAHIGVLRALEKENITVDMVAGTSMGAIVGGLYCAGLSVDRIKDMICNKTLMRAYLTVPIPVRIAVVPVFFLPHIVGYHPYDGLYRGRKFAKFISNAVPLERRKIENMKIPFCAVASNLLDGKSFPLQAGDLGVAVQASSALPFLRRPVELNGQLLVDGGLVENLPCQRVRSMGADIVIAVNVDDDLERLRKEDFRKIGSATARAINMHLSAIDQPPGQLADVLVHPDVSGISLLSTSLKEVHRAIEAGETATMKVMPGLKRMIKEKSIAVHTGSDAS